MCFPFFCFLATFEPYRPVENGGATRTGWALHMVRANLTQSKFLAFNTQKYVFSHFHSRAACNKSIPQKLFHTSYCTSRCKSFHMCYGRPVPVPAVAKNWSQNFRDELSNLQTSFFTKKKSIRWTLPSVVSIPISRKPPSYFVGINQYANCIWLVTCKAYILLYPQAGLWGPGFLADSLPLVQEDILQDPFSANSACLPCRLKARTYRFTINGPIVYMERDLMIFWCGQIQYKSPPLPMPRVMDLPQSKSLSPSAI